MMNARPAITTRARISHSQAGVLVLLAGTGEGAAVVAAGVVAAGVVAAGVVAAGVVGTAVVGGTVGLATGLGVTVSTGLAGTVAGRLML
jgi:hypothetical protein